MRAEVELRQHLVLRELHLQQRVANRLAHTAQRRHILHRQLERPLLIDYHLLLRIGPRERLDFLGYERAVRIQHHVLADLRAGIFQIGLGGVHVGLGRGGRRLCFLQIDRRESSDLDADQVLPHQVEIELQRRARDLEIFLRQHDVPVVAADLLHEILQRLSVSPLRLLLTRLGYPDVDRRKLPAEVLQQRLRERQGERGRVVRIDPGEGRIRQRPIVVEGNTPGSVGDGGDLVDAEVPIVEFLHERISARGLQS